MALVPEYYAGGGAGGGGGGADGGTMTPYKAPSTSNFPLPALNVPLPVNTTGWYSGQITKENFSSLPLAQQQSIAAATKGGMSAFQTPAVIGTEAGKKAINEVKTNAVLPPVTPQPEKSAEDKYSEALLKAEQTANDRFAVYKSESDNQWNGIMNQLVETKKAQVANISNQYAQLRVKAEEQNARRTQLEETMQMRTLGARYAPQHSAGMVNAVIDEGRQRIEELNAQERSAIAQIENAFSEKQLSYALQRNEELKDIRKQRDDQIDNLEAVQLEALKKESEDEKKTNNIISVSGAVNELRGKGIAEPTMTEVYNSLISKGIRMDWDTVAGIQDDIKRGEQEIGDTISNAITELANEGITTPTAPQVYEKIKSQGNFVDITDIEKFTKYFEEAKATEKDYTGDLGTFVDIYGRTPKNMQEYLNFIAQTSAAGRATGGNETTKEDDLRMARMEVSSWFMGKDEKGNPVMGADGYVSPDSYNKARKSWVAGGLLPEDFDKAFVGYANPTHLQDYELKSYLTGTRGITEKD